MQEGPIQRIIYRLFCWCIALVFAIAPLGILVRTANAIDSLDLVRDNVSSITPGDANIGHDIYFVLPLSSQQVTPSDWITIDLPNYSSVVPATGVVGGFGTPIISQIGTKIQITDISLLVGTGLEVQGITATNPPDGISSQVSITISNDQAETQVRNRAITVPITNGGYVSVSTTVETVLSSLNLSGYTSPNAFATLTENGSVVGTTSAINNGFFSFPLTGLPPGAHTYSIFSSDTNGQSTSVTTLDIFLIAGNLTTVTGILLSPSIQLNKTAINPGDTITASGQAKPSSQINLFLEAPLRSYLANTDASGNWSFTIGSSETNSLTPGQYLVYSNVQDGLGNQSITSPSLNFQVNSVDTSNPPPPCDISHGDLNCDHVTNLTDFSILLFHWQTNHRVADINGDGHVNLTDFSIMMFYFTR